MRRRALAALLAVLVVASTLPGGLVGMGAANTQSYTYTNSEELFIVNVGNFSGSFTMQVNAHEDTPSGQTTTIYQEEFTDADADLDGHIAFANYGAYSNVTVKVIPADTASGSVDFTSSNDLVTHRNRVASTGGDADFQCELGGYVAEFTQPDTHQIDCNPLPGSTQVDETETDTQQLGLDIYQSGQNTAAGVDNTQTAMNNHLQDAQTIALIKGKAAYIRALNDGASKSAAETEAKRAINNFYARQEQTIINEWNMTADNALYHTQADDNASSTAKPGVDSHLDAGDPNHITGTGNAAFTLQNGNTTNIRTIDYEGDSGGSYTASMHLDTGTDYSIIYGHESTDYDKFYVADTPALTGQLNEIDAQAADAKSQIQTLSNNTYDQYQNGEINNSDLVDPYVLSSEYSPGSEYQGWSAAQLTLLGTNSPENFDQIGRFNITTESGTQHQGVLFSADNPASGQFETNTTYDPSAIGGTQYVVTADSTEELTENFTIDSIETHDGETRQNVTIVKKQYETTNVSELKQLYEDLAYERAQIEAREQALQAEGGGGGGFLGSGNVPTEAAVGFVAAIVVLAILKD